jgi:hypothetical protein
MKTASQQGNRRRIRATSVTLCAVIAASASVIEAGVPGQRFQIDAHVVSQQTSQSAGGVDLEAMVSTLRSSLVGGGYSLSASVVASPY